MSACLLSFKWWAYPSLSWILWTLLTNNISFLEKFVFTIHFATFHLQKEQELGIKRSIPIAILQSLAMLTQVASLGRCVHCDTPKCSPMCCRLGFTAYSTWLLCDQSLWSFHEQGTCCGRGFDGKRKPLLQWRGPSLSTRSDILLFYQRISNKL